MVFKLFSNVYIGKNNEVSDNIIGKRNIKFVIYILKNNLEEKSEFVISFGKTDETFYEALDICLSHIQEAKLKNENLLICCDDGYTETIPIIIYYLIICLNMNINNAQNFVVNRFSDNTDYLSVNQNKYINKLRSKFMRESLLN